MRGFSGRRSRIQERIKLQEFAAERGAIGGPFVVAGGVDYFKEPAAETGLPYQKLIDLYLLDCAKRRRKLSLKWVA